MRKSWRSFLWRFVTMSWNPAAIYWKPITVEDVLNVKIDLNAFPHVALLYD